MLKLKELTKSFDGINVLDNISTELFKKERIIGICGSNGCGKTTLLNCISGFLKYDGEIFFQNQKLPKTPLAISKLGIQRTFQKTQIFHNLTIKEHAKISNQTTLDIFKKFLPNVKINKKAGALSFGQQKVLELAIAESQKPKLILLDEPLAGISESLSKKISKHILEQKYRAIIIEHDISTLKGLCEKTIKMENGSFK